MLRLSDGKDSAIAPHSIHRRSRPSGSGGREIRVLPPELDRGASVSDSSSDHYFPPPRQELVSRLLTGDKALDQAMRPNLRRFAKGSLLVKTGEEHQTVYRLLCGSAARVRSLEDGRRQIVSIFLPGDLLAVKAMLLDQQPDSVECLAPCNVQCLPYSDAIGLAEANPAVAFRFMWQLAEDERRLHNQVAMLGRGVRSSE